ncbi:MAG: NAD-dependent epimerase/dehydratase family protein [Chloroflexota bacterium]
MSNNLHVIFGTGPVGLAIMDVLYEKGYRVRLVNRSGKTSEKLPAEVELFSGDLSDQEVAVKAAEGAVVLYNSLNPPYNKWAELFPTLQANAIAAAEASNAKLAVIDNLYLYGEPNCQPMTENTLHNAHTKKGKVRAQMAQDLMAAHKAGRVQVVVGRASDFVGPRVMQSTLGGDFVFKTAVAGKPARVVGDVDQPHSYTYMPDIGRALVTLAENEDAFGQVWHLPTPPAISTQKTLEMIYDAAGHPLKMQVAPKWLLRLMGFFNSDAAEMVEMVYEFEQPFTIDDSKFVNRFGWQATELDVAIKETVA